MNSDLALLVGRTVDAVTFVADYSQLQFTLPAGVDRVNLYVWPDVMVSGVMRRLGDEGYRDAYCSLIGRAVTAVVEDEVSGLAIEFESDRIGVSLQVGRDFGWEIATFGGSVWRPDTFPFARSS